MKKQLVLAVALLGSLGTLAPAQGMAKGRYDDRDFGRDYGRGGYGNDSYRRSFDPVRGTLDTLYSLGNRARVDRHEADHIRRAVRDLTQFAERRQRGRFDRGSLNGAIENLRDLARADQLHPRVRERVASHLRDLYQLRDGSDYRDGRRY